MSMTLEERERRAYIDGDTTTAGLISTAIDSESGVIDDLRHEVSSQEKALDERDADVERLEQELEESASWIEKLETELDAANEILALA